MTAKRFTYFKSKIGFAKQGIDDNLKGYTFDFTLDNVLDCMNELNEENEQLKQQLMDCEKFRHTVFQEISKEMNKHD